MILRFFTWVKIIVAHYFVYYAQKDVYICEFEYTTDSWNGKVRKFKVIRTVKEYMERAYLGKKGLIPVYQYACYVSSYTKSRFYNQKVKIFILTFNKQMYFERMFQFRFLSKKNVTNIHIFVTNKIGVLFLIKNKVKKGRINYYKKIFEMQF